VWYGVRNPACEVLVDRLDRQPFSSQFTLTGDDSVVTVPSPGAHQVLNALAAIAVGRELGLPSSAIIEGLVGFQAGNMRQVLIEVAGFTIIEDCYNASPDSMAAALNVLASFPNTGKKIAVVGDMYELGEFTEKAHRLVGDTVADLGIDVLVTVGELAEFAAEQARATGMICASFGTNAEALAFLLTRITDGDVVLVKASRGAKLEEISSGLQGRF
jgi:UDP-N-acetylmuramoyl-tripeptide--D-alanyl-D-alanine ligase